MKDIKDFEGLYGITSCGRVWSYRAEKFLRPAKMKGYFYVMLTKNGKQKKMYVHRLVAEAYIPNPENYEQVNHKDENPENNCFANLEWCDRQYNINYGTRNKRVADALGKKVRCVETDVIYNSMIEAARQTKIPYASIWYCCNGRSKTAGGYSWRKVD